MTRETSRPWLPLVLLLTAVTGIAGIWWSRDAPSDVAPGTDGETHRAEGDATDSHAPVAEVLAGVLDSTAHLDLSGGGAASAPDAPSTPPRDAVTDSRSRAQPPVSAPAPRDVPAIVTAPASVPAGDSSEPRPANTQARGALAARPLDLPSSHMEDVPPPAGLSRLRTGSIPVERELRIDGARLSSFSLGKRAFPPGRYSVELESARGCVAFDVTLAADEIVHLIWDFELNDWRRNDRSIAGVTRSFSPVIAPCAEVP